MKYKELKNKWIGKKVDFDGAYGAQCVDFARQAVKDLYGVNLGGFSGSALNGWRTGSPFDIRWKKIENTLNAIPPAGAVVFFDIMTKNGKVINPYGHVAIAGEGSTKEKLVVLEQNAGTGNGDGKGANAITERVLDYINPARCLGWYMLK